MRLRCRLGYHKWGKYSNRWYMSVTKYALYDSWKEYRIMTSLRCECCNTRKDVWVDTLSKVGAHMQDSTYPIWE